MSYTQPDYNHHDGTIARVDLTGDALFGSVDTSESDILNNWRASHQYPLNTFIQTLRRSAFAIDSKADITSRIKRRPAIEAKLTDRPDIKLSEMQDIGGCRAVFPSIHSVYSLVSQYKNSNFLHVLEREQDYIELPRRTGYRSYHLIYRHYSKRWPIYDGFRIELQIRSQLQHIWATAVETADAALNGRLKAGKGEPEWMRFFVLMSTALAWQEGRPRVWDTPSSEIALRAELRALAEKLDIATRLKSFGRFIEVVERQRISKSKYVVLVLDPPNKQIRMSTFPARQAEQATRFYDLMEGQKPEEGDVVLVRAADAAAVRRGYPSFYRDTNTFLKTLQNIIS